MPDDNWYLVPIFVYGTLKKDQPNHYLLTDTANGKSVFLGYAQSVDAWPLVIDTPFNIPYLLDLPGTGKRITGELYKVDVNMLNVLDKLEEHPHYYRREVISVELSKGSSEDVNHHIVPVGSKIVKCETYILHNFKQNMLTLDYLDCYSTALSKPYILPRDRSPDDPSTMPLVKEL